MRATTLPAPPSTAPCSTCLPRLPPLLSSLLLVLLLFHLPPTAVRAAPASPGLAAPPESTRHGAVAALRRLAASLRFLPTTTTADALLPSSSSSSQRQQYYLYHTVLRQSGPSQACDCPNRKCPVDQTCYGIGDVGFCSAVPLSGNKPLVCTSTATPAATPPPANAPPSPSPHSLGSGLLCFCPKPDCPLNEACFRIRGAGVCFRRRFVAVFKERECKPPPSKKPEPSASPSPASPSPSPSTTASPVPDSPTPSMTPTPSKTPAPSPSTPSAMANPNEGNPGTFTTVASSVPASTNPPVCVAAHHLAHLPAHRLVFAAHHAAPVLCDAAGSCATDGHMVVFRGAPMMMRSYCRALAPGGCERRTMMVNSPRFERGWRAHSHSSGLQFTALAARYASRVEEHALKAALRFGL